MAYNVFKRPMFKRGGSTTGTGIMSHVEPRTIGGGAISGNNMPNNRTGFQLPILTIGEGMASELARGKPGFTSTPFAQYSSPIGPQNVSGPERFLSYLKRFGTRFPKTAAVGPYAAGAGVGIGLGALTDFYARSTKTPEEYKRLKEMSEFGIMDETNLDVGDALAYIKAGGEIGEAPGFFPRGGKKKFFEEKGLDPETGLPLEGERTFGGALSLDEIAKISQKQSEKQKLLETKETIKDEPAYEGTDIKSEVKRESEMLRELLKDDKYSRGEAALIIAGALAEPGTFADKVKKATELAAPVARKRREEDKAITLAAYKLAKEKEQQQIKAGKETDYMRNMRDVARSRVGKPGYEGKSEREILDQLLGAKTEDAEARYYYLKSAGKEIDNRTEDIIETKKELAKLEPGSSKYEKKKAELDEMLRIFDIKYSSLPEFKTIYKGRKEALGLKEGGRVNRAMGSDEDGETSDIVSSQVSFTPETTTKDSISNETVVEKPVENLTFAELRDRLPPEITDDVVQMLASSEEALQDFAYIRTQEDVNQFNVKYGVNLVIPPTQA